MIIELILNVVSIILDIICLGKEFKIKEKISNDVISVSPSHIQISKEKTYRRDKTFDEVNVFIAFIVVSGVGILLYNFFGSLVNCVFFVFALLGIIIFCCFLDPFIVATRQQDGFECKKAGNGLTVGVGLVFFGILVIGLNVLVGDLFVKLIIFCFVSYCLGH